MIRKIKQVNPKFYPVPVKDLNPENGIRRVDKIEEGYLTESEFCELYNRVCGNILHASRLDPYSGRIDDFFLEIIKYHAKLVRLLNHHWVHVSEKIALAVLMKTESDEDVQVTYLEAIPKIENARSFSSVVRT